MHLPHAYIHSYDISRYTRHKNSILTFKLKVGTNPVLQSHLQVAHFPLLRDRRTK